MDTFITIDRCLGFLVGGYAEAYRYGELTDISESFAQDDLQIYPNPAKDKFKVQGLKLKVGSAIISIHNLNGRKLLEKHIPARPAGGPAGTENTEIDVSGLESGVYFCKISTNEKSFSKKLIIQK